VRKLSSCLLKRSPQLTASTQEVINNLGIASVEFKGEGDAEVAPYCHHREVEVRSAGSIRPFLSRDCMFPSRA